ncbi:MAG: SDR family NAD(P)-dependent oxidoreductase [Deltaproteobacteria bacterium]|nr:SDR family NAD(P)-dependent oxidoreductase [Deltaproteobacteria bacterium]
MKQVILVTGARSGFGLEIAAQAAGAGHIVYAGLRDLDTAGPLLEACAGTPVTPLQLDVTDPKQRERAVARVLREQGRLDALVNNAGVALGGFLEQVDEDELRQVLEVNLFGVWGMTVAVLPAMRSQRSGTVVNISSMAGRMAFPGLGAYATSKFALEGMSEAWRHELATFGVRVVLIEPGAYRTDIFERNRRLARRASDPDSPWATLAQRANERFSAIADRQARDPAEIGALVLRVLADPHPRLRYPTGADAQLRSTMVKLLPFSWVQWAVHRMLLRA